MNRYQDIFRLLKDRRAIFFLLGMAAILLLLPHFIRLYGFDSVLIGDRPYYHARISESLLKGENLITDELSYNGRPYFFNPYHNILAFFSSSFGMEGASMLLPFLAGILSVWIFYLILRKLDFDPLIRSYSVLVLILSPAFLYVFSISNTYSVAILLCLTGTYLFLQKTQIYFLLSIVAFFSAMFFDLIIVTFSASLLLAYSMNNKNYMRRFYLLIFVLFLVYLHHYLPIYLDFGFPVDPSFLGGSFLQESISDLGALTGIPPFMIILTLMGISLTWRYKTKIYVVYLASAALLFLSYYLSYVNIYITFIISVFSGISLDRLTRMRYKIKLIRRLTILLIICGLLFSTIAYLNRLTTSLPNKEILDSLEWLRENNEKGLVFSHYSKGNWITYESEFPVFMDSNFFYAPESNERFIVSNSIFNSSTLTETTNLLEGQDIKYIFIDNQMKKDIFHDERQGLLFLTRNNETFKSIYSTNGIEIWEVLGQNAIR